MTNKRISDEDTSLSLEEALSELKRQRTAADNERKQRRAAEMALRQNKETVMRLDSENKALRRDNAAITTQLHQARSGTLTHPHVQSAIPETWAPDDSNQSYRLPTTAAMTQLAEAMRQRVVSSEGRRSVLNILQLSDEPMEGTTALERMSLKRAFATNNLSLDMWHDVCLDADVFRRLWSLCVRDEAPTSGRSGRAQRKQPRCVRVLTGSTRKTVGHYPQMQWHDGRVTAPTSTRLTPVLDTLTVSARATSVSRERPPGAMVPRPRPPPGAESDPESEGDSSSDESGASPGPRPSPTPVSSPGPLPSPPALVSPPLTAEEEGEHVRAPIPQRTEQLIPSTSLKLPADVDSEICGVCSKPGLLTKCDGCCDTSYHWQCVRPDFQPDQSKWMCTACAPDDEWEPLPDCIAAAECVICRGRKPLTQFATLLPECACPGKGNRVCALCACTLDQKAETYAQVRCPMCNQDATAIKMRDGLVVDLVHQLDADGCCEGWVEIGTAYRHVSTEDRRIAREAERDAAACESLKALGADKAARLEARNARKV